MSSMEPTASGPVLRRCLKEDFMYSNEGAMSTSMSPHVAFPRRKEPANVTEQPGHAASAAAATNWPMAAASARGMRR